MGEPDETEPTGETQDDAEAAARLLARVKARAEELREAGEDPVLAAVEAALDVLDGK